jgi:hypothetical protein
VCIATIQRVFSILKGDEEPDEKSAFEVSGTERHGAALSGINGGHLRGPVTEVARRYGVSRQVVHCWLVDPGRRAVKSGCNEILRS